MAVLCILIGQNHWLVHLISVHFLICIPPPTHTWKFPFFPKPIPILKGNQCLQTGEECLGVSMSRHVCIYPSNRLSCFMINKISYRYYSAACFLFQLIQCLKGFSIFTSQFCLHSSASSGFHGAHVLSLSQVPCGWWGSFQIFTFVAL